MTECEGGFSAKQADSIKLPIRELRIVLLHIKLKHFSM